MISLGRTRVLCTVSVDDRVPFFLRGQGQGWVTAEYAMLPRATPTRTPRDPYKSRPSGRNLEIQRMIGRALRAVVDLKSLGEHTFTIDCDVLQGDGGTRTAAITGSYVALRDALRSMGYPDAGSPLKGPAAAISVGVVNGEILLDLCYEEDSRAEVDFNVTMTASGEFVEVQGSAEGKAYSKKTLDSMLDMAEHGIRQLFDIQQSAMDATTEAK